MRSCWAISGFSSILTLTRRTAPSASATAFSRTGPSVLQGPHQGAQKSTITGTSRLASSTSAAKVARPESLMCGLAAPEAAALWAGVEVTGRPPGPIKAMMQSFVVENAKMGAQGLKVKPFCFFSPYLSATRAGPLADIFPRQRLRRTGEESWDQDAPEIKEPVF